MLVKGGMELVEKVSNTLNTIMKFGMNFRRNVFQIACQNALIMQFFQRTCCNIDKMEFVFHRAP